MINSLILFTGYVCNYNCSYCAQKINRGFETENNSIKIINNLLLKTVDKLCSTLFINEKFMNIYNNSLQIIGGESTLINLYSVIDKLINNKNYIKNLKMFTNFSKENDYYLNLIKKLNNSNMNVELTFSFHDEHISLENFSKKLKNLSNKLDFINKDKFKLSTKMVVTNKHNINYLKNFLSISKNTLFDSAIVPVYKPAKEGKYVYTYVTDLRKELYNFILYRSLGNKKTKKEQDKVLELFKVIKKEGNSLSKEYITVVPNLWIKYDGTINYPCKTMDNLNIDNIKLENIYTKCNNIKCQHFNECGEVNIDNNS